MSNEKQPRIEELGHLLANTYTLYLKTQSYHWNVTGPMFTTLHTLFEAEYTELAAAIDEIAERMRALGAKAPGSFSQFMSMAAIKEDTSVPAAMDMIRNLVADQETIVASAQRLAKAAEQAGDEATVDLAVRRILVHQKDAWMLRSHLE